jgi:hypothetical protein
MLFAYHPFAGSFYHNVNPFGIHFSLLAGSNYPSFGFGESFPEIDVPDTYT